MNNEDEWKNEWYIDEIVLELFSIDCAGLLLTQVSWMMFYTVVFYSQTMSRYFYSLSIPKGGSGSVVVQTIQSDQTYPCVAAAVYGQTCNAFLQHCSAWIHSA